MNKGRKGVCTERFVFSLSSCYALKRFNRGLEAWKSLDTCSKHKLGSKRPKNLKRTFGHINNEAQRSSETLRAQRRGPWRACVLICMRSGRLRIHHVLRIESLWLSMETHKAYLLLGWPSKGRKLGKCPTRLLLIFVARMRILFPHNTCYYYLTLPQAVILYLTVSL